MTTLDGDNIADRIVVSVTMGVLVVCGGSGSGVDEQTQQPGDV